MGYGPRGGGGDGPDDSGEHVRPVRRQGQQGRPPRRDATDPRGYERNPQGQSPQGGRYPQGQHSAEDEYAHDEYGRLDYGRGDYGQPDYGRGDVGWSLGGVSGGGHPQGGGGRGGGRRPDLRGIVPEWLPTWPTILAALTAVVFAFILGRVTGGGGDSEAAEEPKVVIETTTTILLTPSTHVVGRGETAAGIAGQYGITVDELAIANNLGDVNHVFVGQNLKIPPPTIVAATTTTTQKKSNK